MNRKRWLHLGMAVLLIGVMSFGAGQIFAKKPGGNQPCPSPRPGWFCPLYYAPVVCGPNDCWYSNQCFAGLAGWNAGQCTPVGPGPIVLE